MSPSADSVDDLCYTPAVELARRVRSREISPVELVEAFLDRIERANPALNAYVHLVPERARAEARAAEAAVLRGDPLGPLHGVPVSIKDLSRTKGVRTTYGSRVFADHVPDSDAPAVRRLFDAGAIMLGKTNTPEFGWVAICDNEVYGRTNNPWDLERTPSGSSGGAGAATAAGLAPISLGSDGGGSIRHPASFCGVVGHKPTFDLVPRVPEHDGWPTLSHQGPLTRTVADAALALNALAGHNPRDLYSMPVPIPDFLEAIGRDAKGLRIAFTPDMGFAEVDPRVRAAFEAALPAFEEAGAILEPGCPDLRDSREIFKGIMFAEAVASDLRHMGPDGASKMNADLAKFIWKRRDILARDYLAATERRQALHARCAEFHEKFDLLLTPTMAIPPFRHPRDMSEYPHTVNGVEVSTTGWQPFTFPFNLTHQPACTVPCGWTDDGLPIGLQIVGRRYEDATVLRAAKAFETARPWAGRRPPEAGAK